MKPRPSAAAPAKTAHISAARIQHYFQETAKSRRGLYFPSIEECELIATSVSNQTARLGEPVGRTVLGKAKQGAKQFLKHLPEARAELRSLYLGAQEAGVQPKDNRHLEGVVEIDRAEKALHILLDRYGDREPRTYTWHELANWIAAMASSAWQGHFDALMTARPYTADDEWAPPQKYPKAVNPDDPLCIFVHGVLGELGILGKGGGALSAEAVSDALRHRRGPVRREGKKKLAKCP